MMDISFELVGFGSDFYISLPARLFGIFLLAGELLLLLAYGLYSFQKKFSRVQFRRIIRLPVFIGLVIFAPIATQLFIIHFSISPYLVTPGIPQEVDGPSLALLGALPWVLAAGMFGGWPAIIVAFAGGLARAGWQTHSIFTPVHFALQAALVAWLLRRNYREWPGKALRNPLIAAMIGGMMYGSLRSLELFAYSGGGFYDGLDYSLALLQPVLTTAVLEAGIAGGICFWLVRTRRIHWYKPITLEIGPYNRSLAARLIALFLILGLVSSSVLLLGDWFLAQSSAKDLIEKQMVHTAGQAGGTIPFFVQTGRGVQNQISDSIVTRLQEGSLDHEYVRTLLRTHTFFRAMGIYDTGAERVYVYPEDGGIGEGTQFELSAAIESALQGIPQEVILRPSEGSDTAQLAFVTPIRASEGDAPLGVIVGVTDLGTNPFLMPVIKGFDSLEPGNAFVTDSEGTILIHEDSLRVLDEIELGGLPLDTVTSDTAPDGTKRLIYVHPVGGYPWNVIVVVPQSEVQNLALQIAANFFAVLMAVGGIVLVSVYIISRRLTHPLRMMSSAAQNIAHGNLAQPVEGGGDDEIGKLANSFEQMRLGLKARLEEMGLLLIASQEVSRTFELDQSLPGILEGIKDQTGADLVRLVIAGDDSLGDTMEVFSSGDDPGSWRSLDRQLLEIGKEKDRIVLENPARARAVLDVHTLRTPIEALLAVTLKNEDAFVGVLWEGYQGPHSFSEDEIRLLSILSAQLGVAVSNARLYHLAEQERSQLTTVLETTPDAVILIDHDDRLTLANPAAEVVLQVSAEQARNKNVDEVISSPELLELILVRGSDSRTVEIQLEDGRVLFASVSDIQSDQDDDYGRVCVLWDITHYKKLDMLKSEFVSTVSHDLRAPLTLMRGYATMLTMIGTMNDQQKEFVSKILSSADQMGTLIDNLLDLGRIEAGLGLKIEKVQVAFIINDVIEAFRPQAVNKQITLDIELDHDLEPIEVDITLLRQAMANLVDNALKYTSGGGSVLIRANQAGGNQHISVTDDGLGIATTDQARLFEKFYRARRKESLSIKGTGLGLAIVKSIAEQHGGTVTLESKLGVGSTFTITIPIEQPEDVASDSGRVGVAGDD